MVYAYTNNSIIANHLNPMKVTTAIITTTVFERQYSIDLDPEKLDSKQNGNPHILI